MFKIVLVQPDIPQNTGNIGRLCVGLDIELHLVHPLGFVLDDKQVQRAGLDYWKDLKLVEHESLAAFLQKFHNQRLYFLTTKTTKIYSEVEFQKGDFLVFGSESKGLPETLLTEQKEKALTIPMPGPVRSLNVANAAAVVAYEVYRQIKLSVLFER